MDAQESPADTTCHAEQSDAVSEAAVVGGGSKYAAADNAWIVSAKIVRRCFDNILKINTIN